MELPKTICMLPWISIETTPMGNSRPCCLALDEITMPDNQLYNLRKHTLLEIYKSEYMQDLRKEFLQGEKPKTCQRCWDEEAAGRQSKRLNSAVKFKNLESKVDWNNLKPDQLWFIDLKLGNICNLKCRICGSWSSSKWAKEEIDYIPQINRKEHLAYQHLQNGTWPRESQEFWDNLKELLPQVRYFEFTGGEPFLIQQHFELLQFAVDQGHSKNISIHYNTNGTVFPEQYKMWEKFEHVEVAFSIDNLGDRFEYERYGAKWNEVVSNLDKFFAMKSKKFSAHLCLTVNIQNVFYLPEICNWIDTIPFDYIYFNMLHDPQSMCISNMTLDAQELVINKLNSSEVSSKYKGDLIKIVKFIQNGSGSDGVEFVQKMKLADQYRNQNFLNSHPEIAQAMGYE